MAVARYYDHDRGEWVLLAAGRDGTSGASSWDDLTDKPATFPPESHTHPQSEVDGLESALDGKASTGHTHTPASIGAAPASHTHSQSEVDGLESALDGKASTGHTHSEYATTSAVEARTPEIRIVTTIPTSPTPGVVYLRFG